MGAPKSILQAEAGRRSLVWRRLGYVKRFYLVSILNCYVYVGTSTVRNCLFLVLRVALRRLAVSSGSAGVHWLI